MPVGEDLIETVDARKLAKVLETEMSNISQNYTRNKDKFILGKDFYQLRDAELQDFKDYTSQRWLVGEFSERAKHLNLWPLHGVMIHVKLTDSPKAWEAYREAIASYFGEKPDLITQIMQESGADKSGEAAQLLEALKTAHGAMLLKCTDSPKA